MWFDWVSPGPLVDVTRANFGWAFEHGLWLDWASPGPLVGLTRANLGWPGCLGTKFIFEMG